jgi:hypothetical protein
LPPTALARTSGVRVCLQIERCCSSRAPSEHESRECPFHWRSSEPLAARGRVHGSGPHWARRHFGARTSTPTQTCFLMHGRRRFPTTPPPAHRGPIAICKPTLDAPRVGPHCNRHKFQTRRQKSPDPHTALALLGRLDGRRVEPLVRNLRSLGHSESGSSASVSRPHRRSGKWRTPASSAGARLLTSRAEGLASERSASEFSGRSNAAYPTPHTQRGSIGRPGPTLSTSPKEPAPTRSSLAPSPNMTLPWHSGFGLGRHASQRYGQSHQ